jgi:hypothetical protein
MADFNVGPGDAVSRLLQVVAKEVGVTDLRWLGKGHEDAKAILVRLHNSDLVRIHLWSALDELLRMPEWPQLPESIQAATLAIILRARACIELQQKNA